MSLTQKRVKVFHLITKLELGGAQKVTLMTLERLPRDQYAPALVTGPEGLLRENAERIPDLMRVWIPNLVREVSPIRDLGAFIQLWKLFRRERPEIVHTHSSKAGILGRWTAWLARVPIIFHTAHGFGFNDYQNWMGRTFYIWLERITRLITTKPVVVSKANAARAEALGVIRPGEWLLCRDAIDIDTFLAPGPRREQLATWGVPPDRVVIGMVACFKPQKAPVDFIDMAARVLRERGNVHFVMVGDGELRSEVEARIVKHGIGSNITLLGWQTAMPEIYRNLDIFVLTSLWEGQPCVFAEAMASGLPVVATAADGAHEAVIDGRTGYLHKPHAIEGLARSVLWLAADPELRRTMGEAGRERVREFDIDVSVSQLESSYRDCLAEWRRH